MPESGPLGNSTTKILVAQTAFLGDVLLSVPLLKNIRLLFPQSEIHYLCRQGLGKLLLELKLVDQVHEIQKGDRKSYQNQLSELQKHFFKRIYCPHESLRTAVFVSRLRAEKKIAFAKWWNKIFFHQTVQKFKSLPEALRQMQMLSPDSQELEIQIAKYAIQFRAGAMGVVPDWASMSLLSAISSLQKKREFICLFPGSVWATKKWTIEGFTEVAKELSEKLPVVLMGGKEEFELGQQIQMAVPAVQNKIGKTSLFESLEILSAAKLVITNDSGGQHMASLVDAPTISIFGPTDLKFGYRPWNPHAVVIENKEIKCRPCGSHGPQVCPLGTHECMKSISAQQVLFKAKLLL